MADNNTATYSITLRIQKANFTFFTYTTTFFGGIVGIPLTCPGDLDALPLDLTVLVWYIAPSTTQDVVAATIIPPKVFTLSTKRRSSARKETRTRKLLKLRPPPTTQLPPYWQNLYMGRYSMQYYMALSQNSRATPPKKG